MFYEWLQICTGFWKQKGQFDTFCSFDSKIKSVLHIKIKGKIDMAQNFTVLAENRA